MYNNSPKAKLFEVTSIVISMIAHMILVFGIFAVFSWPLIGLAYGSVAAVAYILLLAVSGVFRKMAKPQTDNFGVDPKVLKRRKALNIIGPVILASIGAVIIATYAQSALDL